MQINVRKAETRDIIDVFHLSNLQSTRQYSINPNKISWADHVSWYCEVMNNHQVVLYVATDAKNRFLGQVRYNIESNTAEISISLIDDFKGKGYGIKILLKSQDLIKKDKDINRIIAIIKNENNSSLKLFEKAGYKPIKFNDTFSEYALDI